MKRALVCAAMLAACNGSLAGSDAGDDSGKPSDATVQDGGTSDAPTLADASKDATKDAATDASTQCAFSIPHVDDAGVCHSNLGDIDCAAEDPSFDRCVAVVLHASDGGTFGALQCFDGDADTGTIVCCNAVNPSGNTLLFDATWTCCPGPSPDGGTAACDPGAGQSCVAVTGGWTCQ